MIEKYNLNILNISKIINKNNNVKYFVFGYITFDLLYTLKQNLYNILLM